MGPMSPSQESIIHAALSRGLPVIVATHVLESMIHASTPTRAEVQDIANSIRQGAATSTLFWTVSRISRRYAIPPAPCDALLREKVVRAYWMLDRCLLFNVVTA